MREIRFSVVTEDQVASQVDCVVRKVNLWLYFLTIEHVNALEIRIFIFGHLRTTRSHAMH